MVHLSVDVKQVGETEMLCQDTPSPNSVSLLLACHNGAPWLRQLWSGLSSDIWDYNKRMLAENHA
jgi:hypothetical protein